MGRKVRIVRYESVWYQMDRYMIEDAETMEVMGRAFTSREHAEDYAKEQGWEEQEL